MDYLKKPFEKFLKLEAAGGIILLLAAIVAIVLANSFLSVDYLSFWQQKLTIGIDSFKLEKPILLWINDGLMAIFFFFIGLEIKREVMVGELNTREKATLPVIAALGGMVVPVLTFFILRSGKPGFEGWGIPMATDIAFTLGILMLLGKRVPIGLKVFLTAYAIVDDIGGVLVIAFFYSGQIQWFLLLYAVILIGIIALAGYFGKYNKYLFTVIAIVVWVLFLKSGVHPTIAGILLAFTVPAYRKIYTNRYYYEAKEALETMHANEDDIPDFLTHPQIGALDDLQHLTEKTQSPLQKTEHALHGWVTFLIMPVFALANAGVALQLGGNNMFGLSGSIAVSLFVGKAVGISVFVWIAMRLGWVQLPDNVSFKQIAGVAILGGVGFTMSMFISGLAYTDATLADAAKIGIIAGSLISGITGFFWLKKVLPIAKGID